MNLPILDTHEHLWDLSSRPCGWTAEIPVLNHSFLPNQYAEAIGDTGITRSLHMEADVDEPYQDDENNWTETLTEDPHNPICGAIISGRPEREDFGMYLDQWAGKPFVKAVRRVLHTMPNELSQADLFRRNISRLGPLGLPFDLCLLENQLPLGIQLADACPSVTFILDHCGVPAIMEGTPRKWRESIKTLSSFPHVNCKVSGLVAYADAARPLPDQVKPYIDHVIDCFGWNRLVFGSDWPVCTMTSSAGEWIQILLDHLGGEPQENLRKLLHDNATRIYNV